ncbi:MAG: hypothetical protein DWG76_05930 [Chloroflexi bacterium]|nr:hypothetical protein [Chloroflexota bacterium]
MDVSVGTFVAVTLGVGLDVEVGVSVEVAVFVAVGVAGLCPNPPQLLKDVEAKIRATKYNAFDRLLHIARL